MNEMEATRSSGLAFFVQLLQARRAARYKSCGTGESFSSKRRLSSCFLGKPIHRFKILSYRY